MGIGPPVASIEERCETGAGDMRERLGEREREREREKGVHTHNIRARTHAQALSLSLSHQAFPTRRSPGPRES